MLEVLPIFSGPQKAFPFTDWSAWKIDILPTIETFSFTVLHLWECLICKCFASWFFQNKDCTTGAHTYVCICDVLEVINHVKYTYEFVESDKYECSVLMNYFSLYSFYTSTYIANITCLSLGRRGCVENTDQKVLNCEQRGMDSQGLWCSACGLGEEKIVNRSKIHYGKQCDSVLFWTQFWTNNSKNVNVKGWL